MLAYELENLRSPIVIGLQTICEMDLINKMINKSIVCNKNNDTSSDHLDNTKVPSIRVIQSVRPYTINDVSALNVMFEGGISDTPIERSEDVFGPRVDDDVVDDGRQSMLLEDLLDSDEGSNQLDSNDLINLIQFEGSDELKIKMKEICIKYKNIFALSVRAESAKIPPMTFEIDVDKLRQNRRSTSPRPQSPSKLLELKEMISELLRLKVIRVSTEETAAQVLLVAKKDSKKLRFCIDYRALNEATNKEGWPIPNIIALLRRLGSKMAAIFGVMDCTSGYHQAPLSESVKRYTAFITAFGMYEWNRVPMGLKGAPSYFQRMMMTHVLGDLLYKAVEVYLDDMIVFGENEEQFLVNMELVFQRCVTVNLTLNPKKCRFGLSKIEYVGHEIDRHGYTFSRERLDRVVNLEKPSTKGQLKSFLGLVNYFHSHLQDVSIIEHSLTELLIGY